MNSGKSKLLAKVKLAAGILPKYAKYKLGGAPTPVLVTFGITNRCNLKCSYCFANLPGRENIDLPTEKLLSYIDQFIDMGTKEIDLQGGEPTLHPDLPKLIDRIVQRGAVCSMATNGFMVAKHIDALKKCYSICVSIDGTKETTDANRGAGAYDCAVAALDIMYRSGINTRIHGVLNSKTTKEDISHLASMARKYGTNVNFVYALDTGTQKTGCDEKTGFPQHIRELVAYLRALKQRGEPITSKDGAINQVLNWPCNPQDILIEGEMSAEKLAAVKKHKIPRCLWGHMAVFFNTDDRLYLCPRAYDREGYFVKINGRPLKDAFAELARAKKCYNCGQMGDLSYSLSFLPDNIKTWLKF